MKKIIYTVISSLLMVMLFSFSIFAKPIGFDSENYTSVEEQSPLMPENIRVSKVYGTGIKRGNFFSGADLQISNDGNGKIGALAIGHTDAKVDEAYITIYLDRLNESTNSWEKVTSYEKSFLPKDYPNGIINPTVNITFTNQKKGYYYRLRGVFSAVLDGKSEGFSATTDGVMID